MPTLFPSTFPLLVVLAAAAALPLQQRSAIVVQTPAAAAANVRPAELTMTVPDAETELFVDGRTVLGPDTVRFFETPPIPFDARGRDFTVIARWRPNTYTVITRTRTVTLRGGQRMSLDLTVEDPNDRVRVIYVPTPDDVAAEMVRMAAVKPSDIVYEPGCGDARIIIAAVRAGAGRAVGVDIDPERVAEARANVHVAGLRDRIDIREGDALDVKNLSAATVVFLYMGDHFNMLIRPILWRELPVGARIVSHRFLMGDWKPEKSVTITSEDGLDYELHLWTITEDVKRRVSTSGPPGAPRSDH